MRVFGPEVGAGEIAHPGEEHPWSSRGRGSINAPEKARTSVLAEPFAGRRTGRQPLSAPFHTSICQIQLPSKSDFPSH